MRAPGRVNLIGEHTDYNDGLVLPMAIELGTDVRLVRRHDGVVRTVARRVGETDTRPVADLRPTSGPAWARYVAGCAEAVRSSGVDLPGADLVIDGDLPLGSGLSSSASLEVGVLLAFFAAAGVDVAPVDVALLAQRVEHEVIGVRSGIMDQLVVAAARAGSALLIDCRSLEMSPVPMPGGVDVVVFDTGVPRTLAASAYNRRREECGAAAAALGVAALCDVSPEQLGAAAASLDPVVARRARHVVGENARVHDAATALRGGDLAGFGRLMAASHASLRDDYEVSCPELDTVVDLASETPGVIGARMTGAGFGGCAVALVTADQASAAAASVVERYRTATGRPGEAWVSPAAQGAHVVAG